MGYRSSEENLERIANSLHCLNQNIEKLFKFLTEDRINNALNSCSDKKKATDVLKSVDTSINIPRCKGASVDVPELKIFNAKTVSGNGWVEGICAVNNTKIWMMDCRGAAIKPNDQYIIELILFDDTIFSKRIWAVKQDTIEAGALPEDETSNSN